LTFAGRPISVSCPSPSFCAAINDGATVAESPHPASVNPSAWRVVHDSLSAERFNLQDIACPSSTLCVVGSRNGFLMTSMNASAPRPTWTLTQPIASRIDHISCGSVSLCSAVGDGNLFISTNPGGGTRAWSRVDLGGVIVVDVSCTPDGFCAGVLPRALYAQGSTNPTNGGVVMSANPAAPDTWSGVALPALDSTDDDYASISCASSAFCDVQSALGVTETSTNPTGGAAAWTRGPTPGGGGSSIGPGGVSCATPSFCVSLDSPLDGTAHIFESANPATGWSSTYTANDNLNDLSCASATFCVAVADDAGILVGVPPGTPRDTWGNDLYQAAERAVRGGAIKVTVRAPAGGVLRVSARAGGWRYRATQATLRGAGSLTLTLKPTGAIRSALRRGRKLNVALTITYIAVGGLPSTTTGNVTVRR
jgi:hypothetical protein